MKLHLPHKLRAALLACFTLVAATVGTASADFVWNVSSEELPKFTDANWNVYANWELTDGTTYPTAGSGPGTPSSNAWDMIVFNGATGTTANLEGWGFKMTLKGNSNITTTVKKLQGGATINIEKGSTLTINKGTGGDGNDGGTVNVDLGGTLNMVLHRDKGGEVTNLNYGNISTASGAFNVSSNAEGTARTYNSLCVIAVLDAEAVSETTELHEFDFNISFTSDVTLSNFSSQITSTQFTNAGTGSELEATEENIGRYSLVYDSIAGTVKLYYVTGQISTLTWDGGTEGTWSNGSDTWVSAGGTQTAYNGSLNTVFATEGAVITVEGDVSARDVSIQKSTTLTLAENASFSLMSLNVAEGATFTAGTLNSLVVNEATGSGDIVLDLVNNSNSEYDGRIVLPGSQTYGSVTVKSGAFGVNLNGAAKTSDLGAADLILGDGTTYVIRNGNGADATVTTGDIYLKGATDLQVYGSTFDSVISSNIYSVDEPDADTYIRKTDGGTTTLTGTINISSLQVAAGTLKLGDGANVTVDNLRLSQNGSDGNKLVINEGATLTVTGTNQEHSNQNSVILAHWGQTGFFELNGGTFDASGAFVQLSWTGTGTMSVNSGTAKIAGINFWGQSGLKGTFNLGTATEGSGVLELGEKGFHEFGNGATANLGNGTIRLTADSFINYNVNGRQGAVNLIGTAGGTVFDTNGHNMVVGVKHDDTTAAATLNVTGGGNLVKTGEGTLTFNGGLEAGLVTVQEGTLQLNGAASVAQTIINDGTISVGENGSLSVTDLSGLEVSGDVTYSDALNGSTVNGYVGGNYVVIRTDADGGTTVVEGLDKVTVSGTECELVEQDGKYGISMSGSGGIYYVNTGTLTYGAEDNSLAGENTTAVVLNGGNMVLGTALADGVLLTVAQKATLTVGDGVTVGADAVTADAALTLSGSGTYKLAPYGGGTGTIAMPSNVSLGSDWTGTVVVDRLKFNGNQGDLTKLANSNSFVGLTNCTGWVTHSSTVSANLNLLAGDALNLTDGSSDKTQTFSGKIIGDGNFVVSMSGSSGSPNNLTYVFSGDLSGWTGSFKTATKANVAMRYTLNITGSGDIGAGISNASNVSLTSTITANGDRTMGGSITNEGSLNLTVNGSGSMTFAENVTVTKLTIGGTAGVTLNGTNNTIGTLEINSNRTLVNNGYLSLTTAFTASVTDTSALEVCTTESSLLKADGTTASTDGNGYLSSGYYYIIKNDDPQATLELKQTLGDGYKLADDKSGLLYKAGGANLDVYYINNSINYTGSDAALVVASEEEGATVKTVQVMGGAVLTLDNNGDTYGFNTGVKLATEGTGAVRLVAEDLTKDWNVESTLGTDKKAIGNLQAADGVNVSMSFATADDFHNAGTNIILEGAARLKVSATASSATTPITKSMASFDNVSGGSITITPNVGNLILDGKTTYTGPVELVLSQYIIPDGQIFTAAADGKYADLTLTANTSGKAFTLTSRLCGKANALNIGSLSGDGNIDGAYGNQTSGVVGRYVAVHQDTDTTFSGLCNNSDGNRAIGIIKYGTGNLTLTGNHVSTSDLDIREGTITLAETGHWAGAVIVASGAALDMSTATNKSLTSLAIAGGSTLNLGGASLALGSLDLTGVDASSPLTLVGDLPTGDKDKLTIFTGLTDSSKITGITFEEIEGVQATLAKNYIAGAADSSYLIYGTDGSISLVNTLIKDLYWKGTNTTWDSTDADWATEAAGTELQAYQSGAYVFFDGVSSNITIEGAQKASTLTVQNSSTLSLTATGDANSLTVGDITVDASTLTLGGNISLTEGATVTMNGDSTLTLTGDLAVTQGDTTYTGTGIAHTGDSETLSLASGNFTVADGSVTTSATEINAALSGVALATTADTAINGKQALASLTTGDTTATLANASIGDTSLTGSKVSTGASAFSLGSGTTTVTGGSVTTGDGTINAALSGVALTTTADTAINGKQALDSLTTGSTNATLADTTIGNTTVTGSTVSTGASAFSLGSGSTTVTGGSVTTGDGTINATLDKVALTTTTDTTFSGTQTLTSLTAGGTVTVAEGGSVTATSVTNDTLTLAGTGSFSTESALTLAGASTIGSLTADSLAFGDGASLHSTGTLTLTDTTISVGSLAGISSTNQLLTATGGVTSITLDVSLDNLKNGTFDKGSLNIASITDLTSATFADGSTSLDDEANKRSYNISVKDGVVCIAYESTAIGWISDSGTWKDGGESEFSEEVIATSDAGFLGEGSAVVNVEGPKTVGSLIVDVQPDTQVGEYTFTGDSITAKELLVTTGGVVVGNEITADATEVATNGKLTVDGGGTLNAGEATGTITNNGTLSVGNGSVITLNGDGNLTTSGTTTVTLGDGASIDTLTNKENGNVTLTTASTVGTLDNSGKLTVEGDLTLTNTTDNGGDVSADNLVLANGDNTFGTVTVMTPDETDNKLTNTGNLTVGAGSQICILAGSGSITVLDGDETTSIGKIDDGYSVTANGDLEITEAFSFGTMTVAKGKTVKIIWTPDSVTDVTIDTLVNDGQLCVSHGGLTLTNTTTNGGTVDAESLTLGGGANSFDKVCTDTLVFDKNNLGNGSTALIRADEVSTSSQVEGATVLLTQDLKKGLLSAGNYSLISLTGDDASVSLDDYTLDAGTIAAYQKAGLAVQLTDSLPQQVFAMRAGSASDTLYLLVLDDGNRTWNTANSYVYDAFGNQIDLTLDGADAYHGLDNVGYVNVNADNTIDLTDATRETTDGLVVNNLTGDAGKTLTLKGTANDLATLRTSGVCTGGETLSIDGLTVTVDDAGGALTVGALSGTSGTISGNLSIGGTGGDYSGAYDNATITMVEGGSQTLAAGSGLTVAGTAGAAVLTVGDNATMTAIKTEGANVTLSNSGTNTLNLTDASSMTGGKLTLSVSALSISESLAGTEPTYTATTGAPLELNGVHIVVNVTDTNQVTALTTASTDQTITLFQISDAADSSVTGCTLTLNNGTLLEKYFSNIRLATGSIDVVGERQTNYYANAFPTVSGNGATGLDMASKALSYIDPQNHRDEFKDLAGVLDALDQSIATGDTAGADRIAAALSGASVTALGAAQSGDMDRQLRAMRNRVVNMGAVAECIVLDDQPRFHAWINAEGDYTKLNREDMSAGYTLSSWGGTVGFDYDFSTRFTAGLAVTAMYGDLTADGPESSARGDLDNYYLSLFARYATGSWVNSFVFVIGRTDASLSRTVDTANGNYTVEGNTNGMSFGALYELAYTIQIGDDGEACWQPVFNVAVKHTSLSGYDEEGSDAALRVANQTMTSVTLGLGARGQFVVGESVYNRTSVLELRALAKAELGDRSSKTDVNLINAPAYSGAVEGAKRGALGAEVGVGLVVPVGVQSGSLFFDASVELRGRTTNYNGVVGYRFTF